MPADPTTAVRTEHHNVVDVPIPGGSTLRVAVVEDAPEGRTLLIALGFGGDGEGFRRPDWLGTPLKLPAEVLPDLRQALEALEAEG